MKNRERNDQVEHPSERRVELRTTGLSNHRVELKFTAVPVYQLKVRDLSSTGAGIVVRPDSNFLKMIQPGQEVKVHLLTPGDAALPPGRYRSIIVHTSELKAGRFKGHLVVGISIIGKAGL
jgi:hypothetical protein